VRGVTHRAVVRGALGPRPGRTWSSSRFTCQRSSALSHSTKASLPSAGNPSTLGPRPRRTSSIASGADRLISIKARAMTTPDRFETLGAVHEHLLARTDEGGNERGDIADLGVDLVLILHREAHEDLAERDRRDPRPVPVLEIDDDVDAEGLVARGLGKSRPDRQAGATSNTSICHPGGGGGGR
jgi:hypothetical protein